MIHAQRPDATACADYNLWRRADVADRQVVRGSKGIALMDEKQQEVRYVFDYADTEPRNNRQFKLWEITPDNESAVINRLNHLYGTDKIQTLPEALIQSAK
jgi:hypothetical protein